jgi:hypothetical protein
MKKENLTKENIKNFLKGSSSILLLIVDDDLEMDFDDIIEKYEREYRKLMYGKSFVYELLNDEEKTQHDNIIDNIYTELAELIK